MTDFVVAIDAGTTGVRSMIFDITGKIMAAAYQEFQSIFPQPSWVEQKADDWWDATCATLNKCFTESSISPERIAAVSITNQRETIVPVDETGRPLRNAIVWQDRRTVPQCDWIRQNIDPKEIYSTTGLTIDPYFSAPKILWIKENQPDIFSKTHKFLLVHDFLCHRLTNRYVTDRSNASRTMLYSLMGFQWSGFLTLEMDIPREKLPEIVDSGSKIGEVTIQAASESGLKEGTPVVAGGGDQQCAALGVGVVKEGSIKATTGTGTFMLAHTEKPRLDDKRRTLCSSHVLHECFVVEASMFTTGSVLRWFRDNLGHKEQQDAESEGKDPYELMTAAAAEVPPGSEGVVHIPHFVGAGAPYWNPQARGLFAGLSLGHTRAHMMRAILEGVSYEILNNMNVMRSLGVNVEEIRVTGGATRSDVWMQIQADVLGVPVIKTQIEEATALGVAILACKGVRLFKSAYHAVEEMVRPSSTLTPNLENRQVYEKGFEKYLKLYESIKDMTWS